MSSYHNLSVKVCCTIKYTAGDRMEGRSWERKGRETKRRERDSWKNVKEKLQSHQIDYFRGQDEKLTEDAF